MVVYRKLLHIVLQVSVGKNKLGLYYELHSQREQLREDYNQYSAWATEVMYGSFIGYVCRLSM